MLVANPAARRAPAPMVPGGQIRSRLPGVLQRKCACGATASPFSGECESYRGKRVGAPPKLQLGRPDDAYEREADRAAAAVVRDTSVGGARPSPVRVQRMPSGSAAAERLQTLSAAFERLSTAVHDKKLVVGRRFLLDKPATRIEIAVPDWRAFRKMAPGDQVSLVVPILLNEEPDIAHLDSFVLDLARQRGGMANL